MRAHPPRWLLFLALLASPAAGQARPEERIRGIEEHLDAARFDEADAEVRAALASGELDRRTLARTHLLAGVIASARRDENGARASFRRALTLEPDQSLPPSAGPHVAAAFEQARRELTGARGGLRVVASGAQAEAGGPATISVRVVGDSERLAHRLRITAGSFREERPLPPLAQELRVPAPRAGCVDVSSELADPQGNRIWTSAAIAKLCAAEPSSAPRQEPPPVVDSERPLGAPVWLGIALTGAGVAATSVLGVIALDRRSDYHEKNSDPGASLQEREDLRDEASVAQRRATIAAIATAALGAATVTLFVLRPARSGPEVSVRIAPDVAAGTVGGRF